MFRKEKIWGRQNFLLLTHRCAAEISTARFSCDAEVVAAACGTERHAIGRHVRGGGHAAGVCGIY